LFFENYESYKDGQPSDFTCCGDSLVLKVEYLLRWFCFLLGIPTFKDKQQKGGYKIKMEKNIDELLNSLKHTEQNPTGFFEDHRILIKYILSHKMGFNLRNNTAHGLLDNDEYSPLNPFLSLILVLKLGTYKFIKS
jgi:hypothetical protein